jgi:hypothetical protein
MLEPSPKHKLVARDARTPAYGLPAAATQGNCDPANVDCEQSGFEGLAAIGDEYASAGGGQGGRGTYQPNCQMTADQLRTWGKALTPYACFMMLWRYDKAYMAEPANQLAFKEIAALAASKPKPTCKRP